MVEYAFEYTAKDGRLVSIKPNERYVLLKQTNDHWWHVRKTRESRPFYIPAKYVRQLPSTAPAEPSLEPLPPAPLLETADLRTSTGVGREQAPEYEYRFVSAAHECDPQKTETNELGSCSQAHFVSLQAGLESPLGLNKRVLPPLSREKSATPCSLSVSHGSLQPSCPAEPRGSWVGYGQSAEHIRPTVSLDDLARFASHSQAGMGDSRLYKAALWGHSHPLLKSSSENFYKPAEERAEQDIKDSDADDSVEQV